MNLVCKQCGYENESQRVYCHNCGAKLDRSVLPEKERTPDESPDSVRRRVRKFADPGRLTLGKVLKLILSAVGYGFLASVLLTAALPPNDLPPPSQNALTAPDVGNEIRSAQAAGRAIQFSQAQINDYLARTIRAKESENWVKYDRTFVRFVPGTAWTSLQFSIFKYPVYATIGHAPVVENGRVEAERVGGYYGRLPIHPALLPIVARPFRTLWDALKSERELLSRMRDVKIEKQAISIFPGPPGAAPRAP